MKVFVYSRWDGTENEFSLDSNDALRAVSELMMHGLSLAEAMAWLRQHGIDLGGLHFRVMGVQELEREIGQRLEALESKYHLDEATRQLERRFEEILDQEQAALERIHGFESRAHNEFLVRRHQTGPLGARIESFRAHDFVDPTAHEAYEQLLDELEELSKLEQFIAERRDRFRGKTPADYETAQEIRRQVEALERLQQQLASGDFEPISPAELRELLSEDAARSFVFLRDFEKSLRHGGYLAERDGELGLTPRAIRKMGSQALADVYRALQKGRPGEHENADRGAASPRPDETRPYRFGDTLEIDVTRSVLNGVLRAATAAAGQSARRAATANETGKALSPPIRLGVDDLEVRERSHATETTTVLLLDLSWSMSFAGRFAAAKRVAIALEHLVRTAYPRDRFFVVGFSTRARELPARHLTEVTWDIGDPFTNLQAGLTVAERLIVRHPCPSPQVLVITDGQPTAYYVGAELHAEWPLGPGGVSPRAVAETMKAVARVTRRGITINTFMLDDAPELVGFVERMTEVNRGRAFFTAPSELGSFLVVDYVSRRRRRR